MTIRKRFLKGKSVCKVTFKIQEQAGAGKTQAHVVGEFKGWSTSAPPMKLQKNGAFSATVELEKGRSYQFRYLLGQSHWENDTEADDTSRPLLETARIRSSACSASLF